MQRFTSINEKRLPKTDFDWSNFLNQLKEESRSFLLKEFYQHANIDGETPLNQIEFVALDLETTGLDASKNDIVSIGLVPFDCSRIYCNRAKYWLVKPKKKLADESVVIHGLTHSDLNKAPKVKRILSEVIDALQHKVVVVHYRSIERNFLDKAMHHWQKERLFFPVVDTLEIESWFMRKKHHKFWSWLTGQNLASIRLADSRRRYNLPFYQGHNALVDAIATAELFQAQVAYRFRPTLPIKWLLR